MLSGSSLEALWELVAFASIIVLSNAPVEEQKGGWNILKSDIQKLSISR